MVRKIRVSSEHQFPSLLIRWYDGEEDMALKVPLKFELGLLDSESNVLTTKRWDQNYFKDYKYGFLRRQS
ncbi:hypothetical protein SCA6_012820 [Theobroma cacao]